MTILYVLLANILVQIPNIVALLYFSDKNTFNNIIWVNFITLPFLFGASCLFVLYYIKGSLIFSYPMLVLMNIGVTLFVGFILGLFVLKNQTFSLNDFFGFILIIAGILIVVLKKKVI